MGLTLFLLTLAGIFFWAGFLQPWRVWRYKSRVAFVAMLVLAGLAGYVAWRDARAIGALKALVPVPHLTGMTGIPTSTELVALSQLLASMPDTRFTTQAERQALAAEVRRHVAESRTRYWLVKTDITLDSVFGFYRGVVPGSAWTAEVDAPPWLFLSRGVERLFLFVTDDFPRPGTKVLYGYLDDTR